MDQNKALKILSDKERQEYEKLSKIFSSNLNENQLSQGIQYLKNNWKNYSKAMLIALLMNPSISSALETNAPDVYTSIRTELSLTNNVLNNTSNKGNKYSKSFDFSNSFKSGETTFSNKDTLQSIIKDIQDFTKNKSKSKYTITIEASESQVTNPKGYKKGELAKERANKLQQIFEKLGYNNIQVETKIGTTPYEKGKDNPQDQAYIDEQYVKVLISLKAEDLCSFSQDSTNVDLGRGMQNVDFVTFDEVISGKGIIEFSPEKIPDRLTVLDQNNNTIFDTGYIATKKSDYTQWKYVPLYVAGLTEMSGTAIQGSKIKKIKANTLEELVNQLLNNQYNWKTDKRKEVKEGLEKLEVLLNSGVTEFIIYDINPGVVKVPFNSEKGDEGIKVYSPLGKTGYNLKGVCKM